MISPLNKGASQNGGAAPAQNQAIALRVAVIGAVLLALFAIVFFRLWYLQVLSGNSLAAAAAKNRARSVAITAPRGEILDRNGAPLVGNRRAQIVELSPGTIPSEEHTVASLYGQQLGLWHDKLVKKYGTKKVADWKVVPANALKRYPKPQITPLNDSGLLRDYAESGSPQGPVELARRYDRLAKILNVSATEIRRRVITSLYLLPYADIPLTKKGADSTVVDYIAENAELFPGVSTTFKAVRSYPNHEAAAQIFGQVGSVPVNETGPDKGLSTYTKYRKLNLNAQVGLNGLELEYDGYLRGKDGQVKTSIDALGNVTGKPVRTDPISGDNLQLTIDLPLQKVAEKELSARSTFNPNGNPGAIVAMDPRNGEILASQSNPSFDPGDFVRGVSEKAFQAFLTSGSGKPLVNRVTNAGYAAGSTFKPVTAFAAVAQKDITPSETYNDTGTVKIDANLTLQNAGKAVNGPVDLKKALQVSSDVYFYHLGGLLNNRTTNPLQAWSRKLGYGHTTGVDLPGESPGLVPDPKWRARQAVKEKACRIEKHIPVGFQYSVYAAAAQGCGITDMREWSLGDNVALAIGQGDISVTPLQSAVLYAAIENGGTIVRPHFAQELQDRSGALRQKFSWKPKRKVPLAATGALDAIRSGLHAAASEPGGTSAAVFANWPQDKYPIFGKTGTVQKQGHVLDQSWYAAYVPDKDRPIVIVATVEDSGFGAAVAAPIVGEMLKQWYGQKDVQIVKGDSVDQ